MAFSVVNSKGKEYFLHSREQELKHGHIVTLYFFAKEVKDDGALNAVPAGYVVSESKNGLPVLKKAAVAA